MIADKLLSLASYFIPPSVQGEQLSNRLLRARVLIIMLLFELLITGAILLFVLLSSYYPAASKQLTVVLVVPIFAAYLFSLYRFKRTGDLIISANIYILSTFLGVASSIAFTGGLAAAVTAHMLFILPVFAFMITGRRWGLIWTAIACVTVLVYYTLYLQGVQFEHLVPVGVQTSTYVIIWMFSMVLIAACLYVYEAQLNNLTQLIKDKSKQYAYDSLHDPLTGLSNRRLFEQRAKEAIEFAISGNLKAAIIYIDLDDFKPVNDLHGHHIGDEALKITADRLLQAVRSSDTVARLGGDEFAVLLHGVRNLASIKQLAKSLLSTLSAAMTIEQLDIQLGASLGVVVIPDDGSQLDLVLRLADSTMYLAKNNKNRVCFYSQEP